MEVSTVVNTFFETNALNSRRNILLKALFTHPKVEQSKKIQYYKTIVSVFFHADLIV